MLPSLSTLAIAPVKKTRTVQTPVGVGANAVEWWENHRLENHGWENHESFPYRPGEQGIQGITRRIWVAPSNQTNIEEARSKFGKRVINIMYPDYDFAEADEFAEADQPNYKFDVNIKYFNSVAMMLLRRPVFHTKMTMMLLDNRMLLQEVATTLQQIPMSYEEVANKLFANLETDCETPLKCCTNTHKLTFTDLQPEILAQIFAGSVRTHRKPCERVKEICEHFKEKNRSMTELCNDEIFYDMLNSTLGWHKHKPSDHTSTDWFHKYCELYQTYGNVFWCRYEHGVLPVTPDDIGLEDCEQLLLDSVSSVYIETFYSQFFISIANRIDDLINDYFGKIKETMNKDNFRWDSDDNLMYAVGCYGNLPAFEDLKDADEQLNVLRNAMVEMPENEGKTHMMPLGLYRLIYHSRKLVDILLKHSQVQVFDDDTQKKIKAMFYEVSFLNEESLQERESCLLDQEAGDNKLTNDDYPTETFEFMRYLMVAWTHLPCLAQFLYYKPDDTDGDFMSAGTTLNEFGYFRRRKPNEFGFWIHDADTSRSCGNEE